MMTPIQIPLQCARAFRVFGAITLCVVVLAFTTHGGYVRVDHNEKTIVKIYSRKKEQISVFIGLRERRTRCFVLALWYVPWE